MRMSPSFLFMEDNGARVPIQAETLFGQFDGGLERGDIDAFISRAD